MSPPRIRLLKLEPERAGVLKLLWRSFFHYRCRPQLENGNRRLCPWQHYHGYRHYRQWQNGCYGGSCPSKRAGLSLLDTASHSVPRSRTYAIWLLLQLLCRVVPLRPRYRLARVGFSDQSLHHFRKLIVHSVQTTTGGQCMTVLLTAIWPSFANIPNTIPAAEGITTSGMCGFVLYFLLQIPFLCIPYTKVWPCS